MRRWGFIALLLADAVVAIHAHRLAGVLPDRVASHFDLAGNPNGWMTREEFIQFYLGFTYALSAVMLGVSFLIDHLDPDLIHIPNKDYWFAPERVEAGRARAAGIVLWIGVLVAVLMIVVTHVVTRIALGEADLARTVFPKIIVAFVVAMLAVTIVGSLKGNGAES